MCENVEEREGRCINRASVVRQSGRKERASESVQKSCDVVGVSRCV